MSPRRTLIKGDRVSLFVEGDWFGYGTVVRRERGPMPGLSPKFGALYFVKVDGERKQSLWFRRHIQALPRKRGTR